MTARGIQLSARVAFPDHHQLAPCPEPLQVASQHVFDMGQRVGVRRGSLEHQSTALWPDRTGAVGEYQPTATGPVIDGFDGVLAAEMGKELLGIAFGGIGSHHRG